MVSKDRQLSQLPETVLVTNGDCRKRQVMCVPHTDVGTDGVGKIAHHAHYQLSAEQRPAYQHRHQPYPPA